jgi:hypothetical protein
MDNDSIPCIAKERSNASRPIEGRFPDRWTPRPANQPSQRPLSQPLAALPGGRFGNDRDHPMELNAVSHDSGDVRPRDPSDSRDRDPIVVQCEQGPLPMTDERARDCDAKQNYSEHTELPSLRCRTVEGGPGGEEEASRSH